jgi:chromatin segregation and condensation protein Rec8/ScpA/Scc1 (kleisin family)
MEEIVTKADWKLFREKLPGWQERFMEKLVNEYSKMLKDKSMPASEKFWKLEDRIKKDKRLTGVMCEMRKSEVVWNLISLYREGAITLDDLDGFSDKLVERIKIAVE